MMSLRAQMEIAEMKPCAFCGWSTHDFPKDAEHEQKHNDGWHNCGIDGGFRQCCPGCDKFVLAQGAASSF